MTGRQSTNQAYGAPFSLAGRQALVTGGTQGVGAEIARAIARAGGDVVITGLTGGSQSDQVLKDCRRHGVRCDLVTVDLARPPGDYLDELMTAIDDVMPRVSLLVNNAGTFNDSTFLEMDYGSYEKTLHLNVTAGFFITQAYARRWVTDGSDARVVFTGSINGFLAEPGHSAYDTSKGAVAAMIRSLCVELAPHGIRVNSMAPGLVKTPLTRPAIESGQLERWMKMHTPNGEVPEAAVCGDTVVFLLSDAASHVHGQTLMVDGGMSIWQQPDPPAGWAP